MKESKAFGSTESWEQGMRLHLLFISHRCSNRDNNLFKEKQGMEWVIEEWLSLLLRDERWSKWVNNQSREKKGIEWKIAEWIELTSAIRHRCFNWNKDLYNLEQRRNWMKNRKVIGLTFRWSPMFQWMYRSIQMRNNAIELKIEWVMEFTSQSWTMIQSNWDNDNSREKQGIVSETLKGDRAYLSAMTDESNSTGDNYQPRERNKDLNESLLSDRIYFSGTEWVLYSMWCNERW